MHTVCSDAIGSSDNEEADSLLYLYTAGTSTPSRLPHWRKRRKGATEIALKRLALFFSVCIYVYILGDFFGGGGGGVSG